MTTAAKLTTTAGGMNVVKAPGHGIMIEDIHWEHYAERVQDIDMPSLDEGNFLAGSASVFVSMVITLASVALGTTKASSWVYIIFGTMLLTSGVGTVYFWLKYNKAKAGMKKTGAQICKEMRAVAADQKKRAGLEAA